MTDSPRSPTDSHMDCPFCHECSSFSDGFLQDESHIMEMDPIQNLWCELEAEREQREAVEDRVEELAHELYAQRMATSVVTEALDKIMDRFRQNLRVELERCNTRCDRLDDESGKCFDELSKLDQLVRDLHSERDIHQHTMSELRMGINQLKVKVEKDESEIDVANLKDIKDIWSEIESLKETMELNMERFDVEMTESNREMKQARGELCSELQRCSEQCVDNKICCVQTRDLVDTCEKRVALLAVDVREQEQIFSGMNESLRMALRQDTERLGSEMTTMSEQITDLRKELEFPELDDVDLPCKGEKVDMQCKNENVDLDYKTKSNDDVPWQLMKRISGKAIELSDKKWNVNFLTTAGVKNSLRRAGMV